MKGLELNKSWKEAENSLHCVGQKYGVGLHRFFLKVLAHMLLASQSLSDNFDSDKMAYMSYANSIKNNSLMYLFNVINRG